MERKLFQKPWPSPFRSGLLAHNFPFSTIRGKRDERVQENDHIKFQLLRWPSTVARNKTMQAASLSRQKPHTTPDNEYSLSTWPQSPRFLRWCNMTYCVSPCLFCIPLRLELAVPSSAKQSGYVSPGLRPGRMRALRVLCSRRLQHLFRAFGVQLFSRTCQVTQENATPFVLREVRRQVESARVPRLNNPRSQQLANGHSRGCSCSRTTKGQESKGLRVSVQLDS